MTDEIDRRRLLVGIGTAMATVGLAGCTGDGGDGGSDGGDGGSTDTPEDGGDGSGGDATVGEDARQRVESYVGASQNFDGTVADATGQSEVTVEVGVEGNGGNFAFGPPAVAVSSGTTVTWEWTGKGGQHNVVSTNDSDLSFDSGDPKVDDEFEHTFEETGVGLYLCEPHESLNMKGAVVVVE